MEIFDNLKHIKLNKMRSRKILYSIFIAGTVTMIFACTTKDKESKQANNSGMTGTETVEVLKAEKDTIIRNIELSSALIPFEEVHLAPASPGRIETISADISDFVKQGTVLAIMDQTQLKQAEVNLITIETDFKRLDTLKKSGSIAEQQYDQIKARYDVAKSTYDFLLKNTRLSAPFDGVISGKYFEDGEMYSGSPIPAIGKAAILSIVQINNLKAVVSLSAKYFPQISTRMKAEVMCDIYPGEKFTGEVYKIYPTIDKSTSTFQAEVRINNPGLKLRPGMFARTYLQFKSEQVVLVPTIAILKQTGTNERYMYINENGIARKRVVKPGSIFDDKTEILEGIKPGEEIIVTGQSRLTDGTKISITK